MIILIKRLLQERKKNKDLKRLWLKHDRLLGKYIVLATTYSIDGHENETRDILVDMIDLADEIEKRLLYC